MGSCIAELLSVVYQGCMSKNSVCQSTFVCYSTCPSTFPVSERCFDVNIRGNWLTFTVLSVFKKRAEDQSPQCLAWWYMWTWRSAAACVSMPSGPVRCFNVLMQKQQRRAMDTDDPHRAAFCRRSPQRTQIHLQRFKASRFPKCFYFFKERWRSVWLKLSLRRPSPHPHPRPLFFTERLG